ncbi:MAG: ABC transporter permease, partial [Lachnospiraceae bacterium]|nr:ABC transporter permease [Lachnospiraceae bacterium]
SVSITDELVRRVDKMLESMKYVVWLTIVSAAALAFIVMYNLTNINITERIREIATLKVLGFYPKETNIYVFRENFVLTAIGIVAGVFMGIGLHWYVMRNIRVDLVSFDVKILPVSFVIAVLLTFLYAIFVDVVLSGKLERIHMAESLKSVE